VPVEKPGSTTNYRYDLGNIPTSDGLFTNASNLSVPAGQYGCDDRLFGVGRWLCGLCRRCSGKQLPMSSLTRVPASFPSNESRLQAQLEQDITPEMLGASGDGVADDYPAFQAALDLLPAAGGNIAYWLELTSS
jgi:hypothetical protein